MVFYYEKIINKDISIITEEESYMRVIDYSLNILKYIYIIERYNGHFNGYERMFYLRNSHNLEFHKYTFVEFLMKLINENNKFTDSNIT